MEATVLSVFVVTSPSMDRLQEYPFVGEITCMPIVESRPFLLPSNQPATRLYSSLPTQIKRTQYVHKSTNKVNTGGG